MATDTKQTNADNAELAKFAKLAHRWWDKSSEFKALHDINPIRLNYIEAATPLAGKTVLDIGCGGGILAEGMAFRGAKVTGIDMDETTLKIAKLHAIESNRNIDYRHTSVENVATEFQQQDKEGFDVITCMELLEHVPNPESIINACKYLVKPNGHLFFSTINRNLKSYLFAIVGAEYILKLVPRGIHEYAKFIKPSELAAWLRQAGFYHYSTAGMIYNPLLKEYKLSPNDVDVNYFVHVHNKSE